MSIQRTSVGLDVHAVSVVGCGIDGDTGTVFRRRLCPDHGEIRAWLGSLPGPVKVVYEAGPTGFWLCRALREAGIECVVAAPSKLQRPAGDRVKTDARDARHLAKLLRLDEVVEVAVPSAEQEAARDLVRAREDARGDLMRARHRLSKLLLRQGIAYYDGKPWTARHDLWLRRQRFDRPALGATFDADYEAMLVTAARRDRLDTVITELAAGSEWTPIVTRLGCLRGISTLTGFALAVEIGDWNRFTGNTIGAWVGLVPSEYSSGQTRVQGSITKTGNGRVRRLLVEAAWHHRTSYRPGAALRARWDAASPAARARGHAGNNRLHHRWEQFAARNWVGLVPSEYSSGQTRVQGSITKTGNGRVRRLLVEAAWHHRTSYRPGAALRARWDAASPAARARGHAGNNRLHHRWEQFAARKKPTVVANVAVARELAGWCWSLATLEDG